MAEKLASWRSKHAKDNPEKGRSFLPDQEGNGLATCCNAAIAEMALREKYLAEKHRCSPTCPGCGKKIDDAKDRLQWATSTGDWSTNPMLPDGSQDKKKWESKGARRRRRGSRPR